MTGGGWGRLRVGALTMLAMVLTGVGHSVTFPQPWAQGAPVAFETPGLSRAHEPDCEDPGYFLALCLRIIS
jgi:hypothetical protein